MSSTAPTARGRRLRVAPVERRGRWIQGQGEIALQVFFQGDGLHVLRIGDAVAGVVGLGALAAFSQHPGHVQVRVQLALDGIYVADEEGSLAFRRVAPRSDAEIAVLRMVPMFRQLLRAVTSRVLFISSFFRVFGNPECSRQSVSFG